MKLINPKFFLLGCVLAWCGFSARGQGFTFGNYQVVSETRVDRTLFDYVMRVTVSNNVLSAKGVTGYVASSSTNTVVTQGIVSFGDVGQGASAVSQDTFTIRQNRQVPFDPNLLQWAVAVGSMNLDVTVNSPVSGVVTNGTNVVVTGMVGQAVSAVAVNRVAANISGGNFTAVVPLLEGRNVITAVATNQYGGSGTASVQLLRDTTAPTVAIDAPTDGATLTSAQVTVGGTVSDIVSGTVNSEQAVVMVNGVQATVFNRSFVVPDLLLARGTNIVTAVAVDRAGNTSQSQIKVVVRDSVLQKKLIIASGNMQSGVIGNLLTDPLVVALVDANGAAVTNELVTFKVLKSDGILHSSPNSGQELSVRTDQNGLASVLFQLGTRTGVGNNQVAVTSAGVDGEVIFCSSASAGAPAEIKPNMAYGENFRGEVNKPFPSPLTVIVFDSGGNPVAGVPVGFLAIKGGGSLDQQELQATVTNLTKMTDSDGKASVILTLGPDAGVNNNAVFATIVGSTNVGVNFNISGLTPGPVSATRVSGMVLDNSELPIPHARVSVVGVGNLATFTDTNGHFSIPNVPVGPLTFLVNGHTTTRPETFPTLSFTLQAVAGQDNNLGWPIYLPIVDTNSARIVGGDEPVTLTMSGVPGLAFTVQPHSATFPDGTHVGEMSVSQVHANKLPMPPPNGTAPRVVWTLQPAGTKFDPPVQIQLPNTDQLAPGQVIELYQYDHDLEQFVSTGPARVSPDGSLIVSDPGFGITKAGWGGAPPPPPPKTCVGGCDDKNPCTSDACVDGACVYTPTANGTRCDDQTGCSYAICVGGTCSIQAGTQQANGSACDDKMFCTENDKCQNGACVGTPITYPAVEAGIGFDVSALLSLIKDGFKPISSATGCNFGDPSFGGEIKTVDEDVCCEPNGPKRTSKKTIKGSITASLPELECAVPGYGFSCCDNSVAAGLFIYFSVGGNITAQGGKDPCTGKPDFCISGTIQGNIGARAKVLAGGENVLSAKIEGATGGSVSVKCCNGMGTLTAVWNPLTVSGSITVGGWFTESVSWALPDFPVLGPLNFSCPSL